LEHLVNVNLNVGLSITVASMKRAALNYPADRRLWLSMQQLFGECFV
jgi:hypothetical protein